MTEAYQSPDLSGFSTDELCQLMLASGMVGDKDFVKACRDEISRRKPQPAPKETP
jgi:hypothetical protein